MAECERNEVTVRAATRADMPRVHRMIHELAAYEGMPAGPTLSVQGEHARQAAAREVSAASSTATPRDTARLLQELAAYEGMSAGPRLSARNLEEDGFEASPAWFFVLVAQRCGELVGYALCNRAYSSWTRRAFYLEDLYVQESARRCGVARLLLRRLCEMALAEGVHRVDWHVLENNVPARALYARLGARDLRTSEGRAALRLDRANIEAVAGGD